MKNIFYKINITYFIGPSCCYCIINIVTLMIIFAYVIISRRQVMQLNGRRKCSLKGQAPLILAPYSICHINFIWDDLTIILSIKKWEWHESKMLLNCAEVRMEYWLKRTTFFFLIKFSLSVADHRCDWNAQYIRGWWFQKREKVFVQYNRFKKEKSIWLFPLLYNWTFVVWTEQEGFVI